MRSSNRATVGHVKNVEHVEHVEHAEADGVAEEDPNDPPMAALTRTPTRGRSPEETRREEFLPEYSEPNESEAAKNDEQVGS